jgi:hypothetical protein
MKKYYLHNGSEQEGPFYISQLKKKGITRETEVWYRGLSDWTCAGEIDELNVLFTQPQSEPQPQSPPQSPPQLPPIKSEETEHTNQTNIEPKKSGLGKNLLKLGLITIGILGAFALFNMFISNNSKSNPSNVHEKKMTIEETENADPKQFLSVEGKYDGNIWGTKFKVKGEITNKASIANYKDIIIRIKYYSKTKSVIGSEDYTIYEVFPPNQEKSFKLDVAKYNDVEFVELNIIGAKPNQSK